MQLIWTDSGDFLTLEPHHPQLITYWMECLAESGYITFREIRRPDFTYPSDLGDCVIKINRLFERINIRLPEYEDLLDQQNLNDLHRQYVKYQKKHKLVELAMMMGGEEAVSILRNINAKIHQSERTQTYMYQAGDSHWSVPNPFGSKLLEFGRWQAEIHYEDLGRSTYEKWIKYDNNLADIDTNDFETLGGRIQFNLGKPYVGNAPLQYVEDCRIAGVEPVGEVMPLGNFTEDIGQLRHLFLRNRGPLTLHP